MSLHFSGEKPFELYEYLESRDRDNFTLVELGHRATPIAQYQKPFIGQRAYIGVEANLRDPSGVCKLILEEKRLLLEGQNVFFLNHDAGGEAIRQDEDSNSQIFDGNYDARTVLSDGVADEVFLSNVFGDYHISYTKDATQNLLDEVSRLIDDNGTVVVRETITPECVQLFDDDIALAGLKTVAKYPYNSPEWQLLEEVYDGEKYPYFEFKNGIYLIFKSDIK